MIVVEESVVWERWFCDDNFDEGRGLETAEKRLWLTHLFWLRNVVSELSETSVGCRAAGLHGDA